VTFPVGDWFLGVGDGGIGRDQEPLERGRVTSFFGKSIISVRTILQKVL